MIASPEFCAHDLTVVTILDLFDKRTRRLETCRPGAPILDYCAEDLRQHPGLTILYNGHRLDPVLAAHLRARPGDFIEFFEKPQDPSSLLVTVLVSILISAVLTGISYAIQALTAPGKRAREADFNESATYGFSSFQNTVAPGTRIPIVYGEHRVAGHIVQQFLRQAIRSSGGKFIPGAMPSGELNTLIGLCAGEVESVDDVKIDGNRVAELGDVTVQSRLGSKHQATIPYFQDVTTARPLSLTMSASAPPITHSVQQPEGIDVFEVVFRFPAGLFKASDRGQLLQSAVQFQVDYSEIMEDGSQGPWVKLPVHTVAARTRNTFDSFFRSPELPRARYQIRVTRTTPDDSDATGVSESLLFAINEILQETFTYPGVALLGVTQLPTERVSGAAPTYTSVVKGLKVRVYIDLSTYTVTWSDNPAWCLLDLLTSKEHGLGAFISDAEIDLQAFLDWAAWCDGLIAIDERGGMEKRFRLDLVLDGSLSAIEAVKQICAIGQAFFLLKGNQWSVRMDREADAVQQFTMGRIVKDSFATGREGRVDRPNYFFGQFWNRDLEWEQDQLPRDDPVLSPDEEQVETSINLAGASRMSQVARHLNYYMLGNRLIHRTGEFEASTESITMEAGQAFFLSHDVPGWGSSGILRGADSTGAILLLDRTVLIETGKQYEVTTIHDSDAIDVVLVTEPPGAVDRIAVAGTWTKLPAAGTHYAFGEVAKSKIKARCVSITRGSVPWKRRIRWREYNAANYGQDLSVLPAPSISRLPDPRLIPPAVSNLRLSERTVYAEDGTLQAAIDVHFTLPAFPQARAEVYWRRLGDLLWESAGMTDIGFLSIQDNVESPGVTYQISVITVAQNGTRPTPDRGVQASILTTGSLRRPGIPVNFRAARTGTGLIFSWEPLDPVKNFDLAYYEVREGTTWESAILVGRTQDTTLETGIFIKGARTFLLKGVNTAGRDSPQPAAVVFLVDGRIGENIVLTHAEEPSWTGVRQNFQLSGNFLVLDPTADIVAWRARQDSQLLGSSIRPGGRGVQFRTTAIYTTAAVQITTGNAVRTLFSTDMVLDIVDPSLYWTSSAVAGKSWESDFGRTHGWATGPPGKVRATLEMRFSTATSADADFGPWQVRPQNLEVTAKWVQARVTVELLDPNLGATLKSLVIIADVPEIAESGRVTLDGVSSATVTFTKDFENAPRLAAVIVGASAGYYIDLTNVTATGFTLAVRNSGGSLVAGTVEWIAVGF